YIQSYWKSEDFVAGDLKSTNHLKSNSKKKKTKSLKSASQSSKMKNSRRSHH
ncbi:13523_t:CDS:1, partial [Gigaspora rosea]